MQKRFYKNCDNLFTCDLFSPLILASGHCKHLSSYAADLGAP